jgi:hypothetical protein
MPILAAIGTSCPRRQILPCGAPKAQVFSRQQVSSRQEARAQTSSAASQLRGALSQTLPLRRAGMCNIADTQALHRAWRRILHQSASLKGGGSRSHRSLSTPPCRPIGLTQVKPLCRISHCVIKAMRPRRRPARTGKGDCDSPLTASFAAVFRVQATRVLRHARRGAGLHGSLTGIPSRRTRRRRRLPAR